MFIGCLIVTNKHVVLESAPPITHHMHFYMEIATAKIPMLKLHNRTYCKLLLKQPVEMNNFQQISNQQT